MHFNSAYDTPDPPARYRTRTVLQLAHHGGSACNKLKDDADCNTDRCPIDCIVTNYNEWSACDKSCGAGISKRERAISTDPAHGGMACPALVEEQDCNIRKCPNNCLVTEWTEYSTCSVTCEKGTKTKTRSVTRNAAHGGVECPTLSITNSCEEGACPRHCKVSDWSDWSTCTKTCGSGDKQRTRSVITHAAHGGYTCPELKHTSDCSTKSCPIDCVVGTYGAFDTCDKTCGNGLHTRRRSTDQSLLYCMCTDQSLLYCMYTD
jgi:hypothetical protein